MHQQVVRFLGRRSSLGGSLVLVSVLLVASCGSSEPELEFCRGSTRHLYDPFSDALYAWPDDAFAVPAETTTGLRLTADVPWQASMPPMIADMLGSAEGVSGFARLGAVLMRFSHDAGLTPGVWEEPSLDDELLLFSWPGGEPELVPFALEVDEGGTQIRVQPLRPLRAATPHALILRAEHAAADGSCITPARTIRDIFSGEVPEGLERVATQLGEAAEALRIRGDEVSAALTFTTHDDLSMVAEIARDLLESPPTWTEPPVCEPDGERRRCTGIFTSTDFRTDGAVQSNEPQGSFELPMTIWLPASTQAPVPLVLFGHGLNESREQGKTPADILVPEGFAVAAVDALFHGEHPTARSGEITSALDFLGLDIGGPSIDGRTLRGSFVQTALDRQQAMALLLSDPDIDGDGNGDLDTERVGYWGSSLGGLIGTIQSALSDRLETVVLTIAGGNLIEFALGGQASVLVQALLLEMLDDDEAALQRVLLVAQSMADPADPAVFGAHVREERLIGDEAPHLFMPVALHDDIVPPATGRALARALALPHAEPVYERVALLPQAGSLPLAGNADGKTAA
ncbi:MAG: hypothetical protein ACOCVR_04565, partial [Myxococcota bacterium]